MRKALWLFSVLVLTVFAVVGCGLQSGSSMENQTSDAAAGTGITVGKIMPAFSAKNPDGNTVEVGMHGRPYILNFWATWCPPCQAEFPEMNAFANSHTADVRFYAINVQESGDQVTAFLNANGYSLPVLLDKDGSIASQFHVQAIPTTLVVDAQGVIRYRKSGGATAEELENVLKSLK